jgi:amino acid adenylation domain-containing protein
MEQQHDQIGDNNHRQKRVQLSPTKQALFARRVQGEQSQRSTLDLSARSHPYEPAPLSSAQQRLWFLSQLEPDNAVYNEGALITIKGPLRIPLLEQSLKKVIQRHEVLRYRIIEHEGHPAQQFDSSYSFHLYFRDLTAYPCEIREEKMEELAQQEIQRVFDLRNGPLLRCLLLCLGETAWALIVTMHHMVVDGWSFKIFMQELIYCYQALIEGKPTFLSELPLQYADYAYWQQQWLQSTTMQEQLAYWKEMLAGAPPLLDLPTDYPRPAMQTFRGNRYPCVLSKQLTLALKCFSQQENVTLFMTLIGAFSVLLARYSGQTDVLIGVPIANRAHKELEGIIGCFVNTLVLRIMLVGNPPFRELLTQVRQQALGAYAHQDMPFERLVDELHLERNLSYSPLFQVMFNLDQKHLTRTYSCADLEMTPHEIDPGTTKFDLWLNLHDIGNEITGVFEYSTDLFEETTIARMVTHFITILEGIVAQPEQGVRLFPLLTEVERTQLLYSWNQTVRSFPSDATLSQLFEAQVERTPEQSALIFDQEQLTYAELNRRANLLAHYLLRHQVGPEVLVGICIERSIEMVVSLLGVLKAGAAYVPLDPALPQERLAFLLEDTAIFTILTQQRQAARFQMLGRHVVCLDSDWSVVAEQRQDNNPPHRLQPDNLAYVLYTSGSTGKPKGTAISHRSVVNLLYWAREVYSPQSLRRTLASTAITFDLSVFELFVPLCWGGTAILVENILHLQPNAEVTLLNTVPSALAEIEYTEKIPPSVVSLNLAGEYLSNELVQKVYQRCHAIKQIFNLYGPTEATTYATMSLIEKGSLNPTTIGYPIANMQVYVLDRYLQPLPVGVPGQLYLGGIGLARGYLYQPQLTAERFVPNPFSKLAGARLYQTGDLVRYRQDGALEFLGRLDYQVKLRGFRVELGEIEQTLLEHPCVREAAVLLQKDAHSETSLVAYVVLDLVDPQTRAGEATIQKPEDNAYYLDNLRHFMQKKLPAYEVPARIVILPALPLNRHGKLDRHALLEQYQQHFIVRADIVAPRTEFEENLAILWRELLSQELISVYDNFFEIGGHSLLLTRLASRIREVFQVDIPLRQLFAAPTIDAMTTVITRRLIEEVSA